MLKRHKVNLIFTVFAHLGFDSAEDMQSALDSAEGRPRRLTLEILLPAVCIFLLAGRKTNLII